MEEKHGEDDNSNTIVSQESTLSIAISTLDFEHEDDINTITSHNDALESEDEVVGCHGAD